MDVKHYLIMDGKSSVDFDMYISGGGTYLSPEKAFEEVEIPGRNGSIYLYEGAYKNVDITYDAFIAKVDDEIEVDYNFRNLRSYLASREGYFRIEDTYHPEELRFGVYNEGFDPEVHSTLQAVQFTLTFNCKPQRFIKKYYDFPLEYKTSGSTFYNETYFNAKPLIRAYGTGTLKINDVSVVINKATSYTDLDCELQEAYRGSLATNCNSNITLNDAQFPYLKPGENRITWSGLTRVQLWPRTYML